MLKGHSDGLLGAFDVSFFEEDVSKSVPAISVGGVELDLYRLKITLLWRNSSADFS